MGRDVGSDGFDVVIIGAGVVGAAIAVALSGSARSVLVLERSPKEGSGITSRNSGVVHSGLYYPPGSLKAETCLRGQALLYDWCQREGVAHRRTGKLIVARRPDALGDLEALAKNATTAGATGIRLIDGRAIAALEPSMPPSAGALLCPKTGIVDPHGLTRSLRAAAERRGVTFAMGTTITGLRAEEAGFSVESGAERLLAGVVINSAGLEADRLAALLGVRGLTVHPCRGDYFRLSGARGRYQRLIYPIRQRGAAGLGVHLTLELDGGVRLGPDAEYVDSRDDFSPAPEKHGAFLRAAEELLGPVDPERLRYDGCGIRPKLRPPSESQERDFVIHEEPTGCLHLLGIESPGLTAALALAERVALRIGAG